MCKSPPHRSHKESSSRVQAGLSQLHPAEVAGGRDDAVDEVETQLLDGGLALGVVLLEHGARVWPRAVVLAGGGGEGAGRRRACRSNQLRRR
jgi:hypothetical protein